MAEEKTIKSIRGKKDVFERLQKLAQAEGLDQGAALEALLNTWDVQAAKGAIPERAADVADFDASVQALQKAFLRSLELAQNAEARARISYAAQLDVMGGTVKRLEAELEEEREHRKGAEEHLEKTLKAFQEKDKRVKELETQSKLESALNRLYEQMNPEQNKGKAKKNGRGKKPESAEAEEDGMKVDKETGEVISFPVAQ